MVRAGRTDAITNLRDESDRDGIRLVIELKRDVNPEKVVQTLFKKTQLRYTFGVIMLALVDGRPEELDVKRALECWVDHRLDVIRRRAAHDLEESRDRAHVVEGLMKALADIDRVIEIIRGSRNPSSAHAKLRKEFKLSERQADAILAMRLAQLTGLEQKKLRDELATLKRAIEELESLVQDDRVRRDFLRRELSELTERYSDPRRTEILDDGTKFRLPRGGGHEAKLVLISRHGYVKAQPAIAGGGLAGAEALAAREGDFARQAFLCRASHRLLVLTTAGNAHVLPISMLPHGTRSSRGRQLDEFIELELGDEVAAVIPIEDFESDRHLFVATRRGQVKRTELSEYANARAGGIKGTGLTRGDEVVAAFLTDGGAEILLATRGGQAIRFTAEEVRAMGRAARGVKGIELGKGDVVVAALAPHRDSDLLAATSGGFGKRIPLTEFRVQGRAGRGVTILPERGKVGGLVGLLEVHSNDQIAWELSDGEVVTTAATEVLTRARREAGRPVVDLPAGAAVEAIHPLRSSPESAAEEATPPAGDAGPGGAEPDQASAEGRIPGGDGAARPEEADGSNSGPGGRFTQAELGFEG
jgi:DNA gyrase subunit A